MTAPSENPESGKRIAFEAAVRSALVEYGKASIAGVFALNGSAVIAIMAFAGSLAKRPEIIRSVAEGMPIFLAGLVAGAVAWFVTYLSFYALDSQWSDVAHRSFSRLAWFFTALSLAAFVCGCLHFRAVVMALI